jgi:ABC-type transporter Mla subunit MlaD
MAKVATKRIKVHGQWVLPGQPIPDSVKAAEAKELIADGLVREEVSAAEAAAAAKYAEKLGKLRAKADDLRAAIAADEARLAELGGDEKEAKKLTASIAKAQADLDKTLSTLAELE